MKLLMCKNCGDIYNLRLEDIKSCGCGKTSGVYVNNSVAIYSGDVLPIGFNNLEFVNACNKQPRMGDGEEFTSFVIPKETKTLIEAKLKIDLTKLSAQEVFDYVVNHLKAQGTAAGIKHATGFRCAYRDDNNRACAAGCLLDDCFAEAISKTEYNTKLGWYGLVRSFKLSAEHIGLIARLQTMHDGVNNKRVPVKDWIPGLQEVAKLFKLQFDAQKFQESHGA